MAVICAEVQSIVTIWDGAAAQMYGRNSEEGGAVMKISMILNGKKTEAEIDADML